MASLINGSIKPFVSLVLDRFLKPYVENFDSRKLDLGIFSGSIMLKNLNIKRGALDKFRLPVDVVEGHLGELQMKIPWTSLGTTPVEVLVEDLYLLVIPGAEGKVDIEEDERRAQAAKQERLADAELLQSRGSMDVSTEDTSKQQGFVQALITKVTNNVQVTVRNIHIRYEDTLSCPGHPFSAGITLAGFSAHTTDGNWQKTFLQSTVDAVHKLAKLESLSVYFNTDAEGLLGKPRDECLTQFRSLIAHGEHVPKHQYILRPVTGEGRIIINHKIDDHTPRYDAQVLFDELGFVLDDHQYRDVISMVDMYHFYIRQAQYRKHRPPQSEIDNNPRLALLKFATNTILREVHEKNEKWTWDHFRQRRDDRRRYVELYKAKLSVPTLPPTDLSEFNDLESKLSYEDIRFYRSIARSDLRKDRASRKRLEEQKQRENAQHQKGGWLSWAWGSGSAAKSESASNPEDGMTDEQRKELYEVIDYDEKKAMAESFEASPDSLKTRVTASLNKGTFNLRTNPAENDGEGVEVISVVFDAFRAEFLQRPESMDGTVTLGDLRVFDGTSPGTLYHQVVRVKNETSTPLGIDKIDSGADVGKMDNFAPGKDSAKVKRDYANDALFFVHFEQNPLDGRADNAIEVHMKAMEIIYHKGYIEAIYNFFRPPESQLESVGALIDAATATLGEIRDQTRAGLEYALQSHKTVDIKLDMKSPIIIIPEDVRSKQGQHMVLDAGHISIKSDLVSKSTMREIQSKRNRKYTEEDFLQLEALMYDKFFLSLESAQLLIGDDLDSCLNALTSEDEGRELHLLERINIDFAVASSIVPDARNLPKFKVSGKLPSLNINISNGKYKGMMRLIDISIPKFGDDVPQPKAKAAATRPDALKIQSNVFKRTREFHVDLDHDVTGRTTPEVGVVEEPPPRDSTDTFYDAEPGNLENHQVIHQHIFDFSFQVERLQASVYKSQSGNQDKLLAVAVLERFILGFSLEQYTMKVDVGLRSLGLDMIDSSSKKTPLVESLTFGQDTANSEHVQDSITVKYSRVQKDSPEYMPVYEGIDQEVDVNLSTFILSAAPEPILTLYDFIMSTFVSSPAQVQSPTPPDGGKPGAPQVSPATGDSGKLRVRVKLTSIQLILVNHQRSIATLALSAADVAVFLRANTMRVGARLGNLTLSNDSEVSVRDPAFKKIVSIEGEELADLSYETFDPLEQETFPGVNSSVVLRVGSLKVNFLEQPLHDIYHFLVKFARLKSLYDAATQAAVQRASEIQRMKFDVQVNSPILVYPKDPENSGDVLVMKLGEIVASNEYNGQVMSITAGLSGIRLTSHISCEGTQAKLRIIDDVEIRSEVIQTSGINRHADQLRPDTEVKVNMSDVKMALTQAQFSFLMTFVQSVPRVLATGSDARDDADQSAESETTPVSPPDSGMSPTAAPTPVDQTPELTLTSHGSSGIKQRWSTTDLVFSVNTIRLQLYDHRASDNENLKDCGIAKLSINKTALRYKILSDGSSQAEVVVKAFTVHNTRTGASKFREIIPAARHDRNQLMVLFTSTGGPSPATSTVVSIDAPKFILALEPVFALVDFFANSAQGQATKKSRDDTPEPGDIASSTLNEASLTAIRVDLHDLSVMILEDEADPGTQAIELAIKDILFSMQSIMALTVNRAGIFLMPINKPADRVSFLDEIDVTLSMDNRHPEGHVMSSIEINAQPLVFRASHRDYVLFASIVEKALARMSPPSGSNTSTKSPANKPPQRPSNTHDRSQRSTRATRSRKLTSNSTKVIMSKEKLVARFEGLRVVLIGDMHEQPMLHLKIDPFVASCKDWSSELQFQVSVGLNITYWNLTNSHWEPLMDPYKVSLLAGKDDHTGALSVTVASDERLEVNLSTTFIELALTTLSIWSKEGSRALKKARGGDAPYLITNKTGIPVQVWSDADDKHTTQTQPAVTLGDGQSREWRFGDWKTLREHVSGSRRNNISIKFEGRPWEHVRHIPVDREGEFVYALRPRIQDTSDRFLCEVTVKDNVKHVTLRSTYKIENQTLYNIEIRLANHHNRVESQKLAPGEQYCLPIEAVLRSSILVRPDPGFGYTWSSRPLSWEELIKSPSRTISCPYKDRSSEVPFYFQAWAIYDPNDPSKGTYPRIDLRLRAPIELENLLPYDIRYTIYDRNSEKNWNSFLRKGGLMPIHCITLDQLVLLNVEIQDSPFGRSDWTIINADDASEFPAERNLAMSDKGGHNLNLGLNYVRFPDTGGCFRVQVYSPFVLVNKTGLPLNLRTGNLKMIAGQVGNDALSDPTPFMFSHPRRNGAEFSLRAGNSAWSKVINLEAPTAEADISMASSSRNKEVTLGISWAPGLGKYKLSKIVTLSPRFMVRNKLEEPLLLREYANSSDEPLKGGQDTAIYYTQAGRDPALTLKYPGIESEWSPSINMQDIGIVHIRLARRKTSKPDLLRIEVSIEGSVIWIVIQKERGQWPFLLENRSDYQFSFHQVDDRRLQKDPIVYTIPPHTDLPYAWDAPSAREKKLLLKVEGQTREVDVMEIGTLVPFKFRTSRGSKVVSLDVRADNQTQILSISNYKEDNSLYKRRPRSNSGALSRQDTTGSQAETFEVVAEEMLPSFSLNLDMAGIGISLVNRGLVEVVYLTLLRLKMEYTDSDVAQALNFALGWVQLDNQLHEAVYPIVLQPKVIRAEGSGIDVLPAVQASAIVLKDQAHGVTFIKYASILLQAMQLSLDEAFLYAVLDLSKVKGASWEANQIDSLIENATSLPEPRGIQEGQDLYFEVLELQPIQLELSFTRTERENADERLISRNPLAVVLNAFTMTIGNINDAPLRLNALAIKDIRLTVPVLQDRIFLHYKQEVLRQLYRILGSADFIGNPVGLFNNVSSGVADIFYEPYKGVVMHGSKELGIGIAKGAASFAKKTVFGLTDSMTKFTGSIGKGLSAATFDAEYQRQRRLAQRQNKPRHAIYGVTAGVEALGNSVMSGIEGVAMKPIEGAETGGPLGFFKGIGKGLVGVVTKPVVGVFDLASNITEGIRNTTTVFDNDQRNRKRIPRHTPADGILTSYSQREAVGQSWMKDLEQGAYRQDHYVAHYALPNSDDTVMLTTERVVCFSPTRLRVKWDLPLKRLERVAILDTGIRFVDKSGRDYDHFVPIVHNDSKTWFFKEIEKVVNQWNANRRLER